MRCKILQGIVFLTAQYLDYLYLPLSLMRRLQYSARKIFNFSVYIFLSGISVSRSIVLPNSKRKGNLLSSLLVFILGIIGHLNDVEHGFCRVGRLFKLQWLKNSLIVVISFLFILSLFEWGGQTPSCSQIQVASQKIPNATLQEQLFPRRRIHMMHVPILALDIQAQVKIRSSFLPGTATRRYLLIRNIRI